MSKTEGELTKEIEKRKSRRKLLRRGLGVTAAAAGAGALLEMNASTAHATGSEGPTIFTSTKRGTPAVTANGTNGANGVVASSDSDNAIIGTSMSSADAIFGQSASGSGVIGRSNSGPGVFGSSLSGPGIAGASKTGPGVIAAAGNGVGTALQVDGHILVQSDAVGQATLRKGKKAVTVRTSAATANSIIVLTPLSSLTASLWVTRAAGNFTIHASKSSGKDVAIAFLIIN